MRTAWIRISRACNNACRFCDVADALDLAPVPGSQVRAELEAARAARARRVVLTGGEPTLSAHIVKALAYARGLGLRTALHTNGRLLDDEAKIGRLVAVGLDEVHLTLHAVTPEVHVALVGGDPIAHEQSLAALRRCAGTFHTTLRTVLTAANADEIDALVDLAAELGVAFDLRFLRQEGAAVRAPDLALPAPQALAVWRSAHARAARAKVPFTWSEPPAVDLLALGDLPEPSPPDDASMALLRDLRPDATLLAGLRTPPAPRLRRLAESLRAPLADLPCLLAARHTPLVDLPVAWGGADLGTPPDDALQALHVARGARPALAHAALPRGARVAVVVLDGLDPLTATATLPALAGGLAAAGLQASLHSIYRDAERSEARAGVFGRVAGLWRGPADRRPRFPGERPGAEDRAAADALLASLDLVGLACVVVGSVAHLGRLRARGDVPDDLPIHCLDPHLLADFRGLGPHDVVRSPFPGAAHVYLQAGIGLHQVLWRPLPVPLARVSPTTRSPSAEVLVGGGDQVDPALLADLPATMALRPLPGTRAPGRPLDPEPEALQQAFRDARLLWMPLKRFATPDPWPLSWALAAGCPVVGTRQAVMTDHVRPGEAVLWSAGEAQARGIVDLDDARRRALSSGTMARREVVSVARWVDELVRGPDPRRAVPLPGTRAPWWSW